MTENASPLYRLEDSFKKAFPLDGKKLSLEGVSKKWEKISSNSQKISFHKQELPPPNFKSFNKALNKKIFFPLDRKSFSTSRNEEFVKNTFPFDGKTVFTARNIWKMEKTVFHQPEKQFLLGIKFFFKNWPPRFDSGFH